MGWQAALALLLVQAPAADPVAAVEAELGDRLLDGESARWRWYPAKPEADGSLTLCGFLNSKNRMGAYGGFNPVWVSVRDGRVIDAEIAEGPFLDGIAAKRCIAAGFAMDQIPPRK